MKYIRFLYEKNTHGEIVMFPPTMNHIDVARKLRAMPHPYDGTEVMREAVSAGFVSAQGKCYGESISLGIKSDPLDTDILAMQMAAPNPS